MGELLDKTVKVEKRFKRKGIARQNSNFQSGHWKNQIFKKEVSLSSASNSSKPNQISSGAMKLTTPSKSHQNGGFKANQESP